MTDRAARAEEVWTVGRLLEWTRGHFQSRGVDEPRLSAELLLAAALQVRRIELYARYQAVPTAEALAAFREWVRAAARHEPIAYLIGRKEFYSLDFAVTPDVLIPRPETEGVVERALLWCAEHPQERYDVLDVGTGSGCIAVTIARRQPHAHVVASDVSEAALAVAADNARRHGVDSRVRCVAADLLNLPADALPAGGMHLVVSNPPYVAQDRPDGLAENVRRYEPAVALFGGADGLAAFRGIADGIGGALRPGGALILEIGDGQADAVAELFTRQSGLTPRGRFRDLHGLERVLQFERSS